MFCFVYARYPTSISYRYTKRFDCPHFCDTKDIAPGASKMWSESQRKTLCVQPTCNNDNNEAVLVVGYCALQFKGIHYNLEAISILLACTDNLFSNTYISYRQQLVYIYIFTSYTFNEFQKTQCRMIVRLPYLVQMDIYCKSNIVWKPSVVVVLSSEYRGRIVSF